MKIHVENLGPLKKAEFELGDLTIICGKNNTGKTYATYALFGFLHGWSRILEFNITKLQINTLLTQGTLRIDVSDPKIGERILDRGCQRYSRELPRILASKSAYLRDAAFRIKLESGELPEIAGLEYDRTVSRGGKSKLLSITKGANEMAFVVTLLSDENAADTPSTGTIRRIISDTLIETLFGEIFPKPFIASAERTGAAIFSKELNFARNRLLEEMTRTDADIDPVRLLFKSYQDYALPVKVNADFIRNLESVSKEDSVLTTGNRSILNDFSDIIGGKYIAGKNDTLYFKPSGKQVKLTMDESSSAVRSLLDTGFYLRHVAKEGDLFMVDEPELNLHPDNQRRIARLFARLVNLGIKVFITTHSDYIIKELNILIMLNADRPHLRQIAKQEQYQTDELMSAEKIKVYTAKSALVRLKNNKRRSRHQTLVEAEVDRDFGISVQSFDEPINKMNEIQDAIIWGSDM